MEETKAHIPHAGGAPTKYDPAFCDTVIDLGKQGKSVTQIAATLEVTRKTLYNWEEQFPEFLYALSYARELAQAWFEDKGQEGLDKPGFNSSLWAKQVSCRFPNDYRETTRNELANADGKAFEINSTRAEDKAALEHFANKLKGNQNG